MDYNKYRDVRPPDTCYISVMQLSQKYSLIILALIILFGFGSARITKTISNINPNNNLLASANKTDHNTSEQIPTPTPIGQTPERLSLIFGGDVMLDRNVRRLSEQYSYDIFFENLKSYFERANFAIINLEGPITSNNSKTYLGNDVLTKSFSFTFATTTAEVIANAGIDIVSLANNHTDNFGHAGFKETKRWLESAGILYFGDPWNSELSERIIEKNGISVALVGYHGFNPRFNEILKEIKRLNTAGHFIIVMPHWGEEYVKSPSDNIKKQAKDMIEAGARAIIGSHPHVIQDYESIYNAPVFYSLGNLIFDQYFSPEVMKGMLVQLNLIKINGNTSIESIDLHFVSLESKYPVVVETITDLSI